MFSLSFLGKSILFITNRGAIEVRPAGLRSYLDFDKQNVAGAVAVLHHVIEVLFAFIGLPYSMIQVQINQISFTHI